MKRRLALMVTAVLVVVGSLAATAAPGLAAPPPVGGKGDQSGGPDT